MLALATFLENKSPVFFKQKGLVLIICSSTSTIFEASRRIHQMWLEILMENTGRYLSKIGKFR